MTKKNIVYLMVTLFVLVMTSCKKDYLSQDDYKALFSEPTTSEIDNVFNDWQNRSLTPTDYEILQQEDILSGAFKVKIVSFKLNGIKQYGGLLVPNQPNLVPVQILVGGFRLNITTNSFNAILDDSNTGINSNILAFPALRGQSLAITVNGKLYTSPTSEGVHCDAFDKATDDVLAFLNLIQETEANADVNRTGVRGGSRGGTVAMLAGIRDPRIKRVIGVVSPTNMLELTAHNQNDANYQCQFLSTYRNGQASRDETRHTMIASSPIYFAQHLPLMQLHLGLKDKIVPVQQGFNLEEQIERFGNAVNFQFFTYDKTHSDIATNNPELVNRINEFFSQL